MKFVVYDRVHAHDTEAVAGVTRVQKVDLKVGGVAINDMCHGDCRWSGKAIGAGEGGCRMAYWPPSLFSGAFLKRGPCPSPEVDDRHWHAVNDQARSLRHESAIDGGG